MAPDGVANIVGVLERRGFDPRRVGADAWESRCPVHCGTDHDLSISRDGSNRVLFECRSAERCQNHRILHALRLGFDTLYDATPDSLIRWLSEAPIHRPSPQRSETTEKSEACPSTGEAANGPDGAREPLEQTADADATESQTRPEPAGALMKDRVQPTADMTFGPEGAIPPIGGAPVADPSTCESEAPFAYTTDTSPDPEGASIESRGDSVPLPDLELHPSSFIPHPSNFIPHPSSSIPHPSSPRAGIHAVLSDRYREQLEQMSGVALLSHLASSARLLRSTDGRFCAQVDVGGRLEIFKLRSPAFRDWLIAGYVMYQPEPPSHWAISRVVGVLEAQARFNAGIPDVFVRVGASGGESAYFLDLGDSSGQAVVIREDGWCVVERPSVDFIRPAGMQPMPAPVRGGSIELLRRYVNLTDAEFRLTLAWVTAAMRPVGPYPILVLNGQYGSGKSSLAKILRLLVDPQDGPALLLPESTRDMMATAVNGWLLVYENISVIPRRLSDGLCQLAFGGGFASRALYTNDERSVMYAQRPAILVGIDNFVVRADLRDRSVINNLTPIPRARIRTERTFWPDFHADYPQILGALLDAIAGGLRELPNVNLKELPRMADFAEWGEAVCRGLGWGSNTFVSTYDKNRKEASEAMLDGSPVAEIVLQLARSEPNLTTPVSELHAKLTHLAGKAIATSAGWPKTPILFSQELRRLVPQLRVHGLCATFDRRTEGRYVTLSWESGP